MRAWLSLALIVFGSAAAAGIETEPLSVRQSGDQVALRFVLSFETDQQLLITNAVLIDEREHSYELSAAPSGIQSGIRDSCAFGTFVPAGSRQLVALRFRAPNAPPPFTLVLELQSPDPREESGCRTVVLTIEGFEP